MLGPAPARDEAVLEPVRVHNGEQVQARNEEQALGLAHGEARARVLVRDAEPAQVRAHDVEPELAHGEALALEPERVRDEELASAAMEPVHGADVEQASEQVLDHDLASVREEGEGLVRLSERGDAE